jgi:23S rRNA (cytidine1920-2'-O)/16S rRNA (cytidine1409-2'-O)-methyltransferase
MQKERLDVLLVNKGLIATRERAKSTIMAGLVTVDGQRIDKAGTAVCIDADIKVTGDSIGYVSRGGLKLAKGLQQFGLDLHGKVMGDIGASTGGFTDCALKNGVTRVYAIDVGYGQLAWSLRTDERVINMERTNIRSVLPEHIGQPLDFISVDVAFISLSKVLPVIHTLLASTGAVIALIKPQFEAGREKVGKKGVVRDPQVHLEVITNVVTTARKIGFTPLGLTFSPVTGPEGNIEYLIYLAIFAEEDKIGAEDIEQVVKEAHAALAG